MAKFLIAGVGSPGLCLRLTLHQISVQFHILEPSREIKPLGVGINPQTSAANKLMDFGLYQVLKDISVETKDYGFYTKTKQKIWIEAGGRHAGYY